MSYLAQLSELSRTPITLCIITLDFCARTFGVAPCAGTGTPCFNTFPTCKNKPNYSRTTRDYRFSSLDAPLPFSAGERPYLKAVSYLSTEIRDSLTISGRTKAKFADEPDADIGIDPYFASRAVQPAVGTFWKKLIARNLNFKGRPFRILEGFSGLPEGEYQQRFAGIIDNIQLRGDEVEVEATDILRQLADIEIPRSSDVKIVAAITAAQTEITLTAVAGLPASGHGRIGDEIVHYGAINTVTNVISGVTRGAHGTTAAAHRAQGRFQPCRTYWGNPFDILRDMLLVDAVLPAHHVDTGAFTHWRNWPGGEVSFIAVVSEPTRLDRLYFEIIDQVDCRSWVGEDLRITIRRNTLNEPGRTYRAITDEAHIIYDSGGADLHEKSRLTRIAMYWDGTAVGRVGDVSTYHRLDMAVDADAESANEYGTIIEKKVFSRWLRTGHQPEADLTRYVTNTLSRQLFRQRDAQPIIAVELELKDSDLLTGRHVRVTTDELLQADGQPLDRAIYQIVKREFKGEKVALNLLQLPRVRFGFVAPNDAPVYAAATDAQKEFGFISDSRGLLSERPGYYIY